MTLQWSCNDLSLYKARTVQCGTFLTWRRPENWCRGWTLTHRVWSLCLVRLTYIHDVQQMWVAPLFSWVLAAKLMWALFMDASVHEHIYSLLCKVDHQWMSFLCETTVYIYVCVNFCSSNDKKDRLLAGSRGQLSMGAWLRVLQVSMSDCS